MVASSMLARGSKQRLHNQVEQHQAEVQLVEQLVLVQARQQVVLQQPRQVVLLALELQV